MLTMKRIRFFGATWTIRVAPISISLALSQIPANSVRPWILCACPQQLSLILIALPMWDGQAELTWVAGYIPRWFTRPQMVTHPSTNRAHCRATMLNKTNVLPLSQATTRVLTVSYILCIYMFIHHKGRSSTMKNDRHEDRKIHRLSDRQIW